MTKKNLGLAKLKLSQSLHQDCLILRSSVSLAVEFAPRVADLVRNTHIRGGRISGVAPMKLISGGQVGGFLTTIHPNGSICECRSPEFLPGPVLADELFFYF